MIVLLLEGLLDLPGSVAVDRLNVFELCLVQLSMEPAKCDCEPNWHLSQPKRRIDFRLQLRICQLTNGIDVSGAILIDQLGHLLSGCDLRLHQEEIGIGLLHGRCRVRRSKYELTDELDRKGRVGHKMQRAPSGRGWLPIDSAIRNSCKTCLHLLDRALKVVDRCLCSGIHASRIVHWGGYCPSMRPAAPTVDAYLEQISWPEARRALEQVRSIVMSELPDAEECISYGIPMVKRHGMVVGYAAFKNHCSLFPGHTVREFESQLSEFKLSKGTIQFTPGHPIPENLIRAMVRARAAENEASAIAKRR